MNQESSGLFSFLGLIISVIALLFARRYVPNIANLLLILIGVCIFLLILLVVIVIYFSLRKPKITGTQTPSDDNSVLIKNGRKQLLGIRNTSLSVKNTKIRSLTSDICVSIEKILSYLKNRPQQVDDLKQFFHYYLPTSEKILLKYKEIESSGIPKDEITESTITCLEDIKLAMEKQYSSLYDDDILDLTVEMEVLKQICKRDGLLTDEDFNQ